MSESDNSDSTITLQDLRRSHKVMFRSKTSVGPNKIVPADSDGEERPKDFQPIGIVEPNVDASHTLERKRTQFKRKSVTEPLQGPTLELNPQDLPLRPESETLGYPQGPIFRKPENVFNQLNLKDPTAASVVNFARMYGDEFSEESPAPAQAEMEQNKSQKDTSRFRGFAPAVKHLNFSNLVKSQMAFHIRRNRKIISERLDRRMMGNSSNVDLKRVETIFKTTKKRRRASDVVALFAFLGMILGIIEMELFVHWNDRHSSWGTDVLKILVSTTTVIMCVYLYIYYKMLLLFKIASNTLFEDETLITSGLWMPLFLEYSLLIVHAPPFINGFFQYGSPHPEFGGVEGRYYWDDLNLFLLLRVYVLFRFMREHRWGGPKEMFLARLNNVHITNAFSVKHLLRVSPLRFISVCWVVVLLGGAYIFLVCERSVPGCVDSYENALWQSFVSMTTVGYGDQPLCTFCGRFTMSLGTLCSMTISAIATAVIIAKLEVNFSQSKLIHILEKDKRREQLVASAACMIQSAWNLKRLGGPTEYARHVMYRTLFRRALIEWEELLGSNPEENDQPYLLKRVLYHVGKRKFGTPKPSPGMPPHLVSPMALLSPRSAPPVRQMTVHHLDNLRPQLTVHDECLANSEDDGADDDSYRKANESRLERLEEKMDAVQVDLAEIRMLVEKVANTLT